MSENYPQRLSSSDSYSPRRRKTKDKRRSLPPLSFVLIFISGIVTWLVTTGIVVFIAKEFKFDCLKWLLLWGIFPITSFLVGGAASCGYFLAARRLDYRPKIRFFVFILALQAGLYFAHQYAEYYFIKDDILATVNGSLKAEGASERLTRSNFTFSEYYKTTIEASSLEINNSVAIPLRQVGYLWELFYLLGYVGGCGFFGCAVAFWSPYCRVCQRYLDVQKTFYLPARLPYKKFRKKEAEQKSKYEEEDRRFYESAVGAVKEIEDFIIRSQKEGQILDASAIEKYLLDFQTRSGATDTKTELKLLPNWIVIRLSVCSSCRQWTLLCELKPNASETVDNKYDAETILQIEQSS